MQGNSLILVTASHEEFFHRALSREDVENLLKKYPLHQVLDLLAKIDILIHLSSGSAGFRGMMNIEVEIAKGLLPWSALVRLSNRLKKRNNITLVFSRGQLNLLKKLALQVCEFEDSGVSIWDDIKKKDIGLSQIFLGANDLLAAEDKKLEAGASVEEFLAYFCANYSLNRSAEVKKKLARAYIMYHKLPSPVLGYSSVDELFKDKLGGLGLIELLSISFAILAPFLGKFDDLAQKPTAFVPKEYIDASGLEGKAFRTLLGLFSSDLADAKSGTVDVLGKDVSFFTKKPLLRLEKAGQEKYLCMDAVSFIDKFTINLSWILGNKQSETETLQQRKGDSFEAYVRYLLEKYCTQRSFEFRYVNDFGPRNDEELGDAIIIDRAKKMVIFIEAKSSQAPDKIKLSGDLEFYANKVTEFTEQNLKALRKFKELMRTEGEDPAAYTFFPMLVLLEDFPTDDALQSYFRRKVKEKVVYESNEAEVEIVTISSLEGAYEIKADLPAMLAKKRSSLKDKDSFLGNYVFEYHNEHSYDFLREEMDEMFDLMKATLKLKQ